MDRPTILTDRFDRALLYATHVHGEQVRKGTSTPYVAHLLAVSATVLEYGGGEDLAIAGLLHDSVEDQGGRACLEDVRNRFGNRVASVVAACSDSVADTAKSVLTLGCRLFRICRIGVSLTKLSQAARLLRKPALLWRMQSGHH